MAIDDNTSYELTGAQVKDLAQRIKAGGGGGVLIGYINYTAGTVPSGNISVYTDTTYTTAISADDVAAALDNGYTVFFKFTDGWDEIKILSIADSEVMIGDDTIVYHFMASSSKDCIGQLQGHVNDWGVAYFLSTLKTVGNGTLTITQNGTSAGTFSANASGSSTIALTDTTYSAMTGATSGAAGTSGLVPAPAAGDQDKVLKGDGTWGAAADTATVIYMVKTADSGAHDYTVVFYTELAHTNTVSYSTVNEYVTDGKSVLIIDGVKSSGSPLAAVTGAPKGSGPMNTVVDGALYKFSYSSGTTYLDIDGILSADPIQSIAGITPPIQTSMIADGAITSAKLSTTDLIPEVVNTTTYQTAWKFPDGKLICFGGKYNSYDITSGYEGDYSASTGSNLTSIFAVPFIDTPQVTVTLQYNSGLLGFNLTSTSTTGFAGYIWKGQSKSSVGITVRYIAIGKWK